MTSVLLDICLFVVVVVVAVVVVDFVIMKQKTRGDIFNLVMLFAGFACCVVPPKCTSYFQKCYLESSISSFSTKLITKDSTIGALFSANKCLRGQEQQQRFVCVRVRVRACDCAFVCLPVQVI